MILFLLPGNIYRVHSPIIFGKSAVKLHAYANCTCDNLKTSVWRFSGSHSPAKVIGSRSKCYWQFSELNNLVGTGLLSDYRSTKLSMKQS